MNKIITTTLLIITVIGFQNISAMAGGANPDEDLLHGAIIDNLTQVRNALAQGANINAVDGTNTTALHYAVISDYDDIAQYLIARGADVNIADTGGNTPLHHAVSSISVDMVKLLLDNGADPTIRNNVGQAPADLLQSLPLTQQNHPDVRQVRQYLIGVARPMPEMTQSMWETVTLK